MVISFVKDQARTGVISGQMALDFFRAFRAEMWRAGICRDPQSGDEILGVKITGITS